MAVQKEVKSEAETYSADLATQCTLKSEAFEARQKTRAEELEAIEKAIEIISGGAVKGSAEKHLPSLVQKSFVHLRSSSRSSQQQRAAKILKARALRLGSDRLSLLAVKVESDPFAKVIKMIKDMITKLKAGLQGSIGEGPNHSNFSDQSAVNIVSEFRKCCYK